MDKKNMRLAGHAIRPGVGAGSRAGIGGPSVPGIGLGDAIKRVTAAVGIRPCKACAKRAERLNKWRLGGK